MSLKSSLMRYVEEGRLKSFDVHDDKKATLHLGNGQSLLMYMSVQYIIGESEIVEAREAPKADYLVYNTWDTVSQRAKVEARRVGIEIYTFGAFGNLLDKLNANQ